MSSCHPMTKLHQKQYFTHSFKTRTALCEKDKITIGDKALGRISPVTGCGRQAKESEGEPRSCQMSLSRNHTVKTHWRGTATSSYLIFETNTIRPWLPATVNTSVVHKIQEKIQEEGV